MLPPVRTNALLTCIAAVASIWLALALAAPATALARSEKDARVSGICGKGATSQLRLKANDGGIEVEFEVKSNRSGERWRVTLVHERRVVWRGRTRTRSGSRAFRIRRSIPDFDGIDEVSARASGPGGRTCHATTMLSGA
jgi:hypothetical protein